MSYRINPIAVDLSLVRRAFGGGDESLSQSLLEEFRERFDRDRTDPDDEEEPSLRRALQDVISGSPMSDGYGHKYGYLLEMLCEHFGRSLANDHFSGMDSSWSGSVDAGLAEAGIPEERLRVINHLTCRGAPVPIPEPADFPSIGYILKAEVGPALSALDKADLRSLDSAVQDAIGQIRSWLEHCSDAGTDLVCFYY